MKKVAVFLMLLLCMLVALDHSVYADEANSSLTIDGVNVGELGKAQFYPNYDYSAENFLKEFWWMTSDERNSEDAYFSVEARSENATFTLLESVIYTGAHECKYVSSGSCYQPHEIYRIRVVIDDLILTESFTFEMHIFEDRYVNEIRLIDYSGPIYYEYIDDVIWDSSRSTEWYLKTDVKPDGKLAVSIVNTSINSSTNTTTLNSWSLRSDSEAACGYAYEGKAVFTFLISPEGYINFQGNKFYPEGIEQLLNSVTQTSDNKVGNSSSNFYGDAMVAMEEDMMLFSESNGYMDESLIRARYIYYPQFDGMGPSESYTMEKGRDDFSSINLIDGNCFFSHGEYVYGCTLNGEYFLCEEGYEIVANNQYAFYADRNGYEKGLMRYDIRTGEITRISKSEREEICIDQDYLYWIFRDGSTEYLKRMPVDGGDAQSIIESENVCNYIVEDGIIIYWTGSKASELYMLDSNDPSANPVFVANQSEFGGDTFNCNGFYLPYMAFYDGWIYYYYSDDASLICRRNLDGSVVDDFVCYRSILGTNEQLYIFDNKLFCGRAQQTELEREDETTDTMDKAATVIGAVNDSYGRILVKEYDLSDKCIICLLATNGYSHCFVYGDYVNGRFDIQELEVCLEYNEFFKANIFASILEGIYEIPREESLTTFTEGLAQLNYSIPSVEVVLKNRSGDELSFKLHTGSGYYYLYKRM